MSLRKAFEHKLRSFRSYILPSHRKSAAHARAIAQALPSDKPLCVFDFKSIKIDNVTGRYLYHLVTEFEALGYAIAYTDRFRFLATMEAKACKKLLLSHPFSIVSTEQLPESTRILVCDNATITPPNRAKKISVCYEQARAPKGDPAAFEFPFFVHPEIHESGQVSCFLKTGDLTKERPMSILFAGNAKAPKYDEPVLAEKYHVLSRVKALAAAEKSLPSDQVRRPLEIKKISPYPAKKHTLTIATTQDLRIPSQQWIRTLSLADFYFACPGVEMPLCHNLIESLAAGSIPILQYPQYLNPPLENGVNCLVYHDEKGLVSQLKRALTMNGCDIAKLKKNAQNYYKQHLQPGSFAQKLTKHSGNKISLHLNAYRIPR